MLEQLAQLIPVNISVSVNSSDPQERMQLMNDKKSTDSLKIIEKFKQYGLPFYGSIVEWPTIEAEKLVKTIYFLDKNLARTIRVTYPAIQSIILKLPLLTPKNVWSEVLSTILPLRK
jgi:NifB/MoaA-like Fe-S oxidoreductase